MKLTTLLTLLVTFLAATVANAQAPAKFNYQGIARNASGDPLASKPLGMRITIYDGAPTGILVYQEVDTVTTNSFGLYNVSIGAGVPVSGSMAGINWGTGSKFIHVEIDPAGGTTYADLGTTQLLSVPYAMFAAGSANITGTPNYNIKFNGTTTGINSLIYDDGTAVAIGTASPTSGYKFQVINSTATSGNNAIHGILGSGTGSVISTPAAVYGESSTGVGVIGASNGQDAIYGSTSAAGYTGVSGVNTAISGNGISGTVTGAGTAGNFDAGTAGGKGIVVSGNGPSLIGATSPAFYNRLAVVQPNASGIAVDSNAAIMGYSGSSAASLKGGVYGTYYPSNHGVGVQGQGYLGVPYQTANATFPILTSTSMDVGVYGSANSAGILGTSVSGNGILGYSNNSNGVYGYTASAGSAGVQGDGNTYGVIGSCQTVGAAVAPVERIGIFGYSTGATLTNYGVIGISGPTSTTTSRSMGMMGRAIVAGPGTNYGIYAMAFGGGINYAGYFDGNVNITGSISKGSGTFKIDHPLDPEHKYLYHSFVESPDMMNIYNGNITTDAQGYATVTLPSYFDALNKDFRYQLTVIGTFAQAIVKEKVNGNKFLIQTNQPNIEVSWQVTGVRQDKYADAHRVEPEVEKEAQNQGKYIHPAEWGKPQSMGIDYEMKNNTSQPKPNLELPRAGR